MKNISVRKLLRGFLATCLRNCGSMRGRSRIAGFLHAMFFASMREDNMVDAKQKDGSKIRVDLRHKGGERWCFYLGEYEPVHVNLLLSFLPDDGVFVDVGANIGFFTVPVAHRNRRANCRVYAFEPIPSNYQALVENIQINDLVDVFPYNLALSNATGILSMHVNVDNDVETGNAVALSNWKTPIDRTVNCEVNAGRFDDWIRSANLDRVDVVKIDVEGHELFVLEGMILDFGQTTG